MYLHEVAEDSFFLLHANCTVSRARQLVELLNPTHVIVQHTERADDYYLYAAREVLDGLAQADDRAPVFEALDLDGSDATPAIELYADAETVPDRAVVLEEGRVIGFFDVSVPLDQWSERRDTRPSVESREPVPHSLAADFPEQVTLDQTASLLVFLTIDSGTLPSVPLALPLGATVDVVVQPQRGFVLEGIGEGSLIISNQEESLPLQFKLKATQLGPGKVRIWAFHQGQPLGAVTLAPTVVPSSQTADGQRSSQAQQMPSLSVRQPDLSLLILEHESGGYPAFTFRLTALDPDLELHLKPFGPVKLRMDPLGYFHDLYKDIEDLPLQTPRNRAMAERRLAAKGTSLFAALIPDSLQALLWSLKERIKTVHVLSEEPWIPWELCKFQVEQERQVVEGPFLCETFAITRWLPGIGLKPRLTLRKIALVVPRDSDLGLAPPERDYVLSLAGASRQVESVAAGYLEVIEALASGEHDAWHFTGHGAVRAADPNRSAVLLENREELTPQDLSGVVRNLGQAQPLVFLNACQTGRSAMALTDIGGWAAQFLRAGAAAFVGTYWSVFDRPAHDFARAFYERLTKGVPIGQAAQEARAEIRPLGDPTWLAYTVFADPLAAVS